MRHGTADILTDGGTPLFHYGLIFPQANETDSKERRAVQVNCGLGTAGLGLSHFPNSMPHLIYANKAVEETFGGWYACNTTLLYGPAIASFYRSQKETTPAGCADLILYPEW